MAIAYGAIATTINTATAGTAALVTLPTGLSAGDVMIAVCYSTANTLTAGQHSWPAGWTMIDDRAGSRGAISLAAETSVAWRAWQTGDTGPTVTIGGSTPNNWGTLCVRYSGVDTTTPFVQESGLYEGRATSNANPAIAPTVTGGAADWVVATYQGNNTTNPTWGTHVITTSERVEVDAGLDGSIEVGAVWADSNGTVNTTSGVTPSATPSLSCVGVTAWAGILQAAGSPPPTVPDSCGILLG